jgi:site-specific DNA-adenine methylase
VSTIFEKSWWATLPRNKRDRPELGTVSMQGITAYPTQDREGDLYHDKFEGGWKTGRPHNIEAFRNIDPGQKHLNPGYLSATGEIRPDAGILSVERKVRLPNGEKRQKTVGVANALPLNEPFFRLNQKAQTNAYLGTPKKNANRTAHMWTAGDLSQADLDSLISGEKTPQQILGMRENMILGRNAFGDAMMSWQLPDGTYAEAPRLAYEVYDTINPNLPHHLKWKRENRIMRPDVAPPFREDRGHSVSGSVDPLLRIPLWMVQHENPQLVEQSQGKRYVEWVNPRDNTRFEGIPVPLSITGDYEKPFVSRGVSTGTHGLYFDPRDMTGEGMEMWQNALSGDIFQRAWESLQIEDENTIKKMPHHSAGKIKEGQPLPTPLRIQGVKNNKMYREIMQALRQVLGERVMYSPFGGGGGLPHQYQAKRAILNDANPDIGNFMRHLIREPMQIDADKYTPPIGSRITLNHPKAGMIDYGEWTKERATKHGEGKTWLPAFTYGLRDQYNLLRQKAADGTATDEDMKRLAEMFYMIQLTGFQSLVRYGNQNELPSWSNPYSVPAGLGRDKRKDLPDEGLNESLFGQLRAMGLYDPEKDTGKRGAQPYEGGFQPHGTLNRITPLRGGGGISDFSPWHEAMKDWEWRTGLASDFYEDVKEQMTPEDSLLDWDPPYFKEEGAHKFFGLPEQQQTIEQIIDAKNRGIPTVVFNSMTPAIVDPLREAGFDIHELGRKDFSSSKAESRGVVPELLAMANIPQDEFMAAWEQMKGGNMPSQPTLNDF